MNLNPLIKIKPGFSKVHLFDVPKLLMRKLIIKNGELTIKVSQPGLGDHLFYSFLPELLIRRGICTAVFINSNSPVRDDQIFELVWRRNPFISGFSNSKSWSNSGFRPENGSFLDGIHYQFTGEIPKNGDTLPRLYGLAPVEKPVKSYCVIDFNRISNQHSISPEEVGFAILRSVSKPKSCAEYFAYDSPFFKEVIESNASLKEFLMDSGLSILARELRLESYIKRIQNCEHFFGFYSGGAVVAAALGKPATIFCEHKDTAVSFSNQEYVISARATT